MKSDLDVLTEELEAGIWAPGEVHLSTSSAQAAPVKPCWHCGGSGKMQLLGVWRDETVGCLGGGGLHCLQGQKGSVAVNTEFRLDG